MMYDVKTAVLKKSSDGKYAAVSDFTDVSFKIL